MASRLMLVEGEVQRSAEGVVHLMATRIIDRTDELDKLSEDKRMPVSLSPADIFKHPLYPRGQGHPRNVRIVPKSRDFRSEERCVGKECVRTFRSRWSPSHKKKKSEWMLNSAAPCEN